MNTTEITEETIKAIEEKKSLGTPYNSSNNSNLTLKKITSKKYNITDKMLEKGKSRYKIPKFTMKYLNRRKEKHYSFNFSAALIRYLIDDLGVWLKDFYLDVDINSKKIIIAFPEKQNNKKYDNLDYETKEEFSKYEKFIQEDVVKIKSIFDSLSLSLTDLYKFKINVIENQNLIYIDLSKDLYKFKKSL